MRFATTMKRSDSCSPIGFPLALWALLSLTFRRRQTSQIRCYYLTCARCALEPRWVFPYLALSIGRCCLLPGGRHRLPHTRNEAVSLHAFALRLRTLHCLRLNLTSRLRLQGYVLTARYGFVRRRLSLLCNNNAYWRTPPLLTKIGWPYSCFTKTVTSQDCLSINSFVVKSANKGLYCFSS